MKEPMKTHSAHVRDGSGHLDPRYAADLLARSRSSVDPQDRKAFLGANISRDALAEELGESFVRTATGGEDDEVADEEDMLGQVVPEEIGGPFIETTGEQEFAYGTDASNPEGATREPFPKT